jgi:hypothetical protein
MQVKNGLCYILSRFEVAPCKDTPLCTVFDSKSFELKPDGEMPLSFKRSKFWNTAAQAALNTKQKILNQPHQTNFYSRTISEPAADMSQQVQFLTIYFNNSYETLKQTERKLLTTFFQAIIQRKGIEQTHTYSLRLD